MASSRILVVDDFEDWRQKVRSILQQKPDLQVIAEAADGAEALQKAEEADLIVLDIALPKLDGIRAARKISEVSPGSKILYCSYPRITATSYRRLLAPGHRDTFTS